MKCTLLAPFLSLLCFACSTTSSVPPAVSKPAWSYTGANGPAHWGELSPQYALAKSGTRQSPIDIQSKSASRASLPPLQVNYAETTLEILNNGHTIEDDYHGGGTLNVGGHEYRLAQFHFHSPSEHTLDGVNSPMEMHLVHKDAQGQLAVIGVMISEGAAHPELAKLWKHLPAQPGRAEEVPGESVNAAKLLPASLSCFRYSGSLTTPPCSEDVSWFVLRQPITASAEQIAAFRSIISGNNRPTQPLNGRVVNITD